MLMGVAKATVLWDFFVSWIRHNACKFFTAAIIDKLILMRFYLEFRKIYLRQSYDNAKRIFV